MPFGLDQGIGAIVWSPLGWGRLTGKISRERVHCLEPCQSPEEDEYAVVLEDVLDAAPFKFEWGRYDVDTPTAEDRTRVKLGEAMMKRLRRGR